VLVQLRLHLSGGVRRLLAQEVEDESETPYELVRRISKDGRVPLGDRESCPLEAIERIEVVAPPAPQRGPTWGSEYGLGEDVPLRDEDVETALREGADDPGARSDRPD
jgi:hypothetical protein